MPNPRRETQIRPSARLAPLTAAALCAALIALLCWAPRASAVQTLDFCLLPGSAAGQCASPVGGAGLRGLAVDFGSDRLYVADRDNNRVDVFDENGEFQFAFGWGVDTGASELEKCTGASTCQAGIAGSGAGQFDRPGRIAVDNTSGSHAIYVPEDKNHRVQQFGPEGELLGSVGSGEGEGEGQFTSNIFAGVGPGGVLYVLDNPPVASLKVKHRLQRFKPNLEPFAPQCMAFEGGKATGFAVEADGDFWVANILEGNGIHKFDAGCALLLGGKVVDPGIETNHLAIGEGGKLFSEQRVSEQIHAITAYDSSGNYLRRFGYGLIPAPSGEKPEGFGIGAGGVFLAMGAIKVGVRRLTYPAPTAALPPPGPIASPSTVKLTSVRAAKATAVAEVNPEGKPTQVHFDYITEAAWQADGEQFGAGTKSTPDHPLGAEGFELKSIEAPIGCPNAVVELPEGKCLAPETEYRFRVVATNADGEGEGTVEGEPFTTEAAPLFGAAYATALGTDTARLSAEVNPEAIPTSGYFEYVSEEQFLESGFAGATQVPDVEHGQTALDFGAGEALATRSATIGPLEPATSYRYRLIAQNPLGQPVAGETEAFRTFASASGDVCPANEALRLGEGALLPDCRAYEMVSPLDKGNGDIRVLGTHLGFPAVLEQSAASGDGLAYGSVRAFGDALSSGVTTQYIAQRVAGQEWRTHAIVPPQGEAVVAGIGRTDTLFKYFSADLCEAWMTSFAEPPLGPGAVPGYSNLYRRSDRLCGPEGYEALAPLTETPGVSNANWLVELQDVSADGTHALLRTTGKLAPQGSAGQLQLYESSRGEALRMVCILPSGAPLDRDCSAGAGSTATGTRFSSTIGALSADGSRVFWSPGRASDGPLYVRENPAQPESARVHGAATGTATVIGPAVGTGNLTGASPLVKNAKASAGGFAPGQEISDGGGKIPPGTKIVNVEETAPATFTLTLSANASGGKIGDALTGAASATVVGLTTESGAFAPGQQISGPGIPRGSSVLAVDEGEGTLTLSATATQTKIGGALEASSPCTETATKACTVQVSAAAEEEADSTSAFFWGASADGGVAIFSTGGRLFRYDVGSEATTLIAAGQLGVMGISEDASRVYFGSSQEIPGSGENSEGDSAQPGQPNLYFYEDGAGGPSTSFVATLAGGDLSGFAAVRPLTPEPILRGARVSPDGAHAAFTSQASLTGYENKDATTGEAATEVYLYQADTHQLLCASCNPSGARPVSAPFGNTRFAARILGFETQMHAARNLSADGSRLYFESADMLSPRDTNGKVDVYQWEAPGAGGCTPASPSYSAQDEGCVDLISSGHSPLNSRFVEADPSGKDVFFATAAGLLPQDPGLVDIYDAREGGGLPVPVTPAACEGEACQSPPEAPNDPTPASSAFEGAGNVVGEGLAKPGRCAKGRVKKHGKCTARKHHKRANHKRRSTR